MADFETTVMNAVRGGVDLSLRQAAILLLCRNEAPDQERTVGGLAAELKISRPSVSRALDRLETLGFGARRRLKDRRVVAFDLASAGDAIRSALLAGMKPGSAGASRRKAT